MNSFYALVAYIHFNRAVRVLPNVKLSHKASYYAKCGIAAIRDTNPPT